MTDPVVPVPAPGTTPVTPDATSDASLSTEVADLKQAVGDVATALRSEIEDLRDRLGNEVIDRLQGYVDALEARISA
jgi:hypothetical protein